MKSGKIAVLIGGKSSEAQVSLQTGQAVVQALKSMPLDIEIVDLSGDYVKQLSGGTFSKAFIAAHGHGAEDGVVQAVLEAVNIPYTGSGILASALAMDKIKSKLIWQELGLSTPRFSEVSQNSDGIDVPIVIKPVSQGSSIGVSIVKEWDKLAEAISLAFEHDKQVMAEQYIEGAEFTVGIVGQEILPVIRIMTTGKFYDYDAKYRSEDTKLVIPSGLSAEQEKEIKSLARQSFRSLGCSGWGRVDFMQDIDGQFYILEVNTIPGLTAHSLVPTAAASLGWSFSDLILNILKTADEK